jgi:CBS domain containing-hemolysin-like protein
MPASLEIATDEVAASGQLNEAQRILIENIFEMEDRTAEELMTSRSRMHAIAISIFTQRLPKTWNLHQFGND